MIEEQKSERQINIDLNSPLESKVYLVEPQNSLNH